MLSIPQELEQFVKIKTTNCLCHDIDFEIQTYTIIATDPDGKIPKKHRCTASDDNTYVKYPELIKIIPRGLSIAIYNGKEVCRLDGLEKFDGSCPLDDDNECSTNIFNRNATDINKWTNLKVEFLEKANGKMAIFKVFKMNNRYYILGGSKNVHVVVDPTEEIKGSILHHDMLRMFQRDFFELSFESLLNKTIIGEYVDGQHIIYVKNPYMVYFSGPLISVKRILPDQYILPTQEQLRKLRYLENIEGIVVVYTNLDNGTIFRQKHKTIWYILIRVMREALKRYTKEISTDTIVMKVFDIFKKRSDDFLALTEEDFNKWYTILKNFVSFVKQSKYNFSDLDFQKQGIGVIFAEFVEYKLPTQNGCDINGCDINGCDINGCDINGCDINGCDNTESLETPDMYSYIESLYESKFKICIIMRGPTGSGKSTIAKKLKNLYPDTKIHSTDDLFVINGEYKFEPDMLETLHNDNFRNFNVSVLNEEQCIIVDNTNILYHEYGRYLELARNNGYITVILQCKKMDPDILFARSTHNVPITSIIQRLKKYQFVDPLYAGIFFKPDQIKDILPNEYIPVQKTPLHITLYWRNQVNSVECRAISIGKKFQLMVKSFCISRAGKFLKVSAEGFENHNNLHNNLHITLETHEGFKPVDVGTYPEITTISINKQISGIFGPIF